MFCEGSSVDCHDIYYDRIQRGKKNLLLTVFQGQRTGLGNFWYKLSLIKQISNVQKEITAIFQLNEPGLLGEMADSGTKAIK